MPVTNQEILMKTDGILVTRTDLKGIITDVNDEFVNISGFTRDELIGKPHNIVRHPDMPSEFFEDLWQTIKAASPWQGVIKNRTKSGDYYWVEANVIPIFKNAQVVEYLSVRRAPSRDQIRETEKLIQLINAQKITLKPTGLAAITKAAKEMNVWKKMSFALAFVSIPVFYLMYLLFLARDYPLMAGVSISVLMSFLIAFNVTKSLAGTINKTVGIFYRLAEKRFGNVKDLSRNDLIGDFQRALYSMEVRLNLDLGQAREDASKAQQISQALDNAKSGVMVINNNLEIIYVNDSVERMFIEAEQDIRRQLPNFNARSLMGTSINSFHKNPTYQQELLKNLTKAHKNDLNIGGQHMSVTFSPIINNQGERIGFVAEWQNRTRDVLIEQEIDKLVQDIKAGDLSARINMSDKEGFAKGLSAGINELTDVIESAFNDINKAMENMSKGDLTQPITNEYQGIYAECRDNINNTIAKLSEFITDIRSVANFIDGSSQEIASGNHNLSDRAEQQAASLQETAASMEELASTVKENGANTQTANQVVAAAGQLAKKGGEVVVGAIKAMQEINESSNKIAEIIDVIDEIAFQTNLLALNAAVEAARAGEQGRGFSVVATEVRNLAQRSAVAAKQSSELIESSSQRVRAGTAFVNETGEALKEIVSSVGKVGDIVSQIASASVEQIAGIDQVNLAVSQMDDITQQNAALAEQMAAGSVSMSEQSTRMANLLDFFKVYSEKPSSDNRITSNKAQAPGEIRKTPALPLSPNKNRVVHINPDDEWEEF